MSFDVSGRAARWTALFAALLLASVTLTASPAPAAGPPVVDDIVAGFEDGTTQGWAPRIGRETLTVTDADAHGGTHSLLVTGRQATYDGPALNVLDRIVPNTSYTFSAWVKLAPGQAAATLRLSVRWTVRRSTA